MLSMLRLLGRQLFALQFEMRAQPRDLVTQKTKSIFSNRADLCQMDYGGWCRFSHFLSPLLQ